MERLLTGYQKFQQKMSKKDASFFAKLKNGQKPEFLILSCCDSRIEPAQLFQCEEGILFQERNVANIVYPYNNSKGAGLDFAAALEFAVKVLKVKEIIVLGHSQCGGIEKLLKIHEDKPVRHDLIGEWVKVAIPAAEEAIAIAQHTSENLHRICEKQNILNSIRNLMTYPFVEEAVENGTLGINGFYVHVGYNDLEIFDKKQGRFISLHP